MAINIHFMLLKWCLNKCECNDPPNAESVRVISYWLLHWTMIISISNSKSSSGSISGHNQSTHKHAVWSRHKPYRMKTHKSKIQSIAFVLAYFNIPIWFGAGCWWCCNSIKSLGTSMHSQNNNNDSQTQQRERQNKLKSSTHWTKRVSLLKTL